MPELVPPVLVEDARGLERLLSVLAGTAEIAFDTEADSFFNYREKVCLIQITAGGTDYLVDPLAGFDVTGLADVFGDPSRTKVFHDGEYDILILKRDFGFRFAAIFDTRVAAAALGSQNPGLASVIQAHFDHELDKSMQRSNWSQRPLSPEQIAYARYDTHFLIPLMHILQAELVARGRADIAAGECRRLEQLQPTVPSFDPDEFVRIKGARALSPQGLQNLRELYCLRERLAQESNLPPFKVLGNHTLLALAAAGPRTTAELARVGGFSGGLVRRLGAAALDALERARKLGHLRERPTLARRDGTSALTESEVDLHDQFKEWRKGRAQKDGMDASLVLNRHVLLRLAKEKPKSMDELRQVAGLLPWQADLLGDEILAVIAKHGARPQTPGDRRRSRRR